MKAFKIIVPIYIICFLLVASLGAVVISKAYAATEIGYNSSANVQHNPPPYPPECKTLIFDYYTDATYKTIVENAEETTTIKDGGLDAGGVSMFYESSNTTAYVLKKTDIVAPANCSYLFAYLDSLTTIELRNFNTSSTTNMSGMFYRCFSLETIEFSENFNTENVTTMTEMFRSCNYLKTIKCAEEDENVIKFNTSNVTSMSWMFDYCKALTSLDLSSFNTENVTNMSFMFQACSSLGSITFSTNFKTANVKFMSYMFFGCAAESLDLSSFNTSSVTGMSHMFFSCGNLKTVYVGDGWSTSNVTNSERMFEGCINLEGKQGTKVSKTDKTYAKVDGGTSDPGYFTHINDKETT